MRLSTLATTGGAALATAVLGGLASRPAESAWYARLHKPGFQPPRQVFPIVWPILYADIATVSASVVDEFNDSGRPHEARKYAALLAANLVMNGGWSWLFFSRRRLGASAILAGALTVSSADLTRRAVVAKGSAGAVLGLYPAWCAFATLLSGRIWALNR
jgi:tryptophan-rich sensory protein